MRERSTRSCARFASLGRKVRQFATFPETVVPYYPYFSFVLPPYQQGAPHLTLYEHAVVVPGPVTDAVAEACRREVVCAWCQRA